MRYQVKMSVTILSSVTQLVEAASEEEAKRIVERNWREAAGDSAKAGRVLAAVATPMGPTHKGEP